MDDLAQARERGGRLDELPEHESDADVAGQQGGGIIGSGGTAEVRGTGELRGNAQGGDEETGDAPMTGGGTPDETPGIRDFTEPAREPDDGAAGQRPGRLDREADDR